MSRKAVMALALFIPLAACESSEPLAPEDGDRAAATAISSNRTQARTPVLVTHRTFNEISGSGVFGEVSLRRTKEGLRAGLIVKGLVPGYAYSVWWAIFDHPEGCIGPCDSSDLAVPEAQGSLINGGGFVGTGSTIKHRTRMLVGNPEGKSVHTGDPAGVNFPYEAEIHIVARNHGPAETDPANLALQIGTFDQFCNLPGCVNEAVSVFTAPNIAARAGVR